ncbi:unnamed protein product [Phytophthora lilii]|uniref:Unnamed protein product n=1 Tax=Phytophthora lilii TaxID=2077276 RepID=A0A9W6WUF8_9STRA|nr:unnamed protein product [Phytophthora lilii]
MGNPSSLLEYKQLWSNVRAMAELTTSEVEKHGADSFLFPDDWEAIKHTAAAGGDAGGDGYSNNYMAGNSSLALASGEPVRSNSGFIRRVLNNPPEVAGTASSHGWPTLTTGSSQAIAQMRGTGAFKKGTVTKDTTMGEWFYMLKIRLVDLHPIFAEIDLVGNPQLKLKLKVQTRYSDITCAPNGTASSRKMSLTSTTRSLLPIHAIAIDAPLYDIANPTQIVSKPMKTIKYLDCYSQFVEDQAGIGMITSNKTFSVQVASSHKNVRYVCLLPFANTKSGNYTASITTPQLASPFDSAPWTMQPGSSIRDFQVQVGNKNVFQDMHSYDWMTFLDEFSKIGAVNGDLSREISNGLIGIDKWQTAQRILAADCSRVSDVDVPQSIKVSGTNIATQGTNFLVLVVYERTLEIDKTTGEVFRAD